MAASNLKDLFSLDNNTNIRDGSEEGLPSKRLKKSNNVKLIGDELESENYSLEALWDSSQYDEEHSIETFIQKAKNVI